MLLADAPLLRHGILGTPFVGMTAVTKQRQEAIGGGGKVVKSACASQLTSRCTCQ